MASGASGIRAAGAVALACAFISGCGQDRRPTPANLDLVNQRLDEELNAPVENLRENLVRSLADGKIFPEEMVVRGEGNPTPVDWWTYDKGLVRMAGVDRYEEYFVFTPKGESFAAERNPHWLEGVNQGQPRVVCAGGGSWASCQVTGVASVRVTPEGAGYLEGRSFPDAAYQADLVSGPSGWRVDQFQSTGQDEISEVSRRMIFGDDATIAKGRERFIARIGDLLGRTSAKARRSR